jgi:hypothetical protein
MFHKFSEETMRRRGGNQAGRESVVALATLDAVLKAEKLFDPSLLEPLAAFTNLLQSSQLPPEFGNYSFGDALLAIEEAHAELRQNDEQRWEFTPELTPEAAGAWLVGAAAPPAPSSGEHADNLRSFVFNAVQSVKPSSVLVVGALSAPELPLAELSQRCERLTLSDTDLTGLEELVRRTVPEAQRAKLKLERYDVTGSCDAFLREARGIVSEATSIEEAAPELASWLASYDVGSGSAGLATSEEKPGLAISAMLLNRLGREHGRALGDALSERGWDRRTSEQAPLKAALDLFGCLLQHHHVQALLRRAGAAMLVSPVSQVELRRLPNGQDAADGEPADLLFVERLSERLPQSAGIKAEQSWEHRGPHPSGDKSRSLVTLVEAVLV